MKIASDDAEVSEDPKTRILQLKGLLRKSFISSRIYIVFAT